MSKRRKFSAEFKRGINGARWTKDQRPVEDRLK